MTSEGAKGPIGFLPLGIGLLLCGIAAFDPRDDAFSFGRISVLSAGLVFGFAGLAVLINGLKSRYRSTLLGVNGTLLLGCFGAVPVLIAWKNSPTLPLMLSIAFLLLSLGSCVRATVREFFRARSAPTSSSPTD